MLQVRAKAGNQPLEEPTLAAVGAEDEVALVFAIGYRFNSLSMSMFENGKVGAASCRRSVGCWSSLTL